jgi:hypothetical protein
LPSRPPSPSLSLDTLRNPERVTGTVFTQVLPFYDPRIVDLYGKFEEGLYDGLSRA